MPFKKRYLGILRENKEALEKNIVDNELQRYLKPFNFAQKLFFHSNFVLKNNFITPNGMYENIVSIVATCVYASFIIYRASTASRVRSVNNGRLYLVYAVCRVANCIIYFVGFFTILDIILRHSSNNVALVLKIQEVKTINKKNFDRTIFRDNFLSFFGVHGFVWLCFAWNTFIFKVRPYLI